MHEFFNDVIMTTLRELYINLIVTYKYYLSKIKNSFSNLVYAKKINNIIYRLK